MNLIKEELVKSRIYKVKINGEEIPVVLDRDIAEFYGIEVRHLNQAVKRNINRFRGCVYQLTKEQYLKILEERKKNPDLHGVESFEYNGGSLPSVYTESGAIKVSSVLRSERADEVQDILLKSFFAVKSLIITNPEVLMNQKIYELNNRVSLLESKIENRNSSIGTFINNGNVQIGNENRMTVKINDFEDIIRVLGELLSHPKIKGSEEYKAEIKEAISLAMNEDKKGLLDKLEKVSNIVNGIADLAMKASPVLLPIISWLMALR